MRPITLSQNGRWQKTRLIAALLPFLLFVSWVITPDRASGEDAGAKLPADGTGALGFSFDTSKSPFPPELHAQVVEVMNLIYNFDFDTAISKAEKAR